jgi:L-asparaginase
MAGYTLELSRVPLPAIIIHGGAGAYLKTTTRERRLKRGRTLRAAAEVGHRALETGGARRGVLAAIEELERDPGFNAGYGSRLQRDGVVRVSAALMDGKTQRMSAVYNVKGCLHPSRLADALQSRPDRNLDGEGAALLMQELGVAPEDLRSPGSLERWRKLIDGGDQVDREAAIGDAGEADLERARRARLPVPKDLDSDAPPDEKDRYGTVGAVAAAADGPWACTSTGGRGHEAVGRVSDTPTPAGNYACPQVAISATGFGEQILDLNVCGRIAARVLDGLGLEQALRRTFDEVAATGGLLGVIAITDDGHIGYAHTTEACGVAWIDGDGAVHLDRHGRP